MSRHLRISRRRSGSLGLWMYSALALLSCARGVDSSGVGSDSFGGEPGEQAGALGIAGQSSGGSNASGGLEAASGASTAGALGVAGTLSTAGAPAGGGQAGASLGGGSSAGSAGSGTAGAAASGAGGAGVAGGGGAHACKVDVDLNGYTPSKPGCGNYTSCKGQIHWRNDETQTLTQVVLSFTIAAGASCTTSNSASKWTISDNGAASHRCTYTSNGNWTVESNGSFGFGYDTSQKDATVPTGITISDPSCN